MDFTIYNPSHEVIGTRTIEDLDDFTLANMLGREIDGEPGEYSADYYRIERTMAGASFYLVAVWLGYAGRDADGEKLFLPYRDSVSAFFMPRG
jgi:hypothetical protein